ncbi:CLUMA_CG002085, isoform A [Clunio marinus]|uniref:CLUMA_CG002085, isoform A n=1 Tax=Clunio marinus TaxID=568069 RepID=A0A1J1HL92_9DIPT|nr:CLUMA_CG002085, isoform A [Clunio marinus]
MKCLLKRSSVCWKRFTSDTFHLVLKPTLADSDMLPFLGKITNLNIVMASSATNFCEYFKTFVKCD